MLSKVKTQSSKGVAVIFALFYDMKVCVTKCASKVLHGRYVFINRKYSFLIVFVQFVSLLKIIEIAYAILDCPHSKIRANFAIQ